MPAYSFNIQIVLDCHYCQDVCVRKESSVAVWQKAQTGQSGLQRRSSTKPSARRGQPPLNTAGNVT